ncbi:MAG TPA: hypothetical protein PLV70_11020 [Flavobacteriales bacterium]|nr:hypothetical protein [Flavobacteriales bacterium]
MMRRRLGHILLYLAATGMLMLAATGCTREELVAPGHPDMTMHTKASGGAGDSVLTGNSDNGWLAPISDDGDDLGDKERSKPKN